MLQGLLHSALTPTPRRWASLFPRPRRLVCAAIVACLAPLAQAQSAATASVSGRVLNTSTGEYIRNVEVSVKGTPLSVLTEDGGYYRIANIAPGDIVITVHYTGYDVVSVPLTVRAGESLTRDFELKGTAGAVPKGEEITKLNQFVVSAEREGDAKAIMEQKGAMNVKTVVATDSYGDIAEGNIGEFLKFMPGITLDYVETDTRAARMGGLEASFGAVTLDGGGMANTGTGTFGDNTRQFEFEAISINNIETIEVNKTLSADMSADAPAGTVNLRSKSALDRKGQIFNFRLGVIGNQYEHSLSRTPRHDDAPHAKTRPTFDFDYSNNYFGKKLGIAVNGAFTNVYKEQFRHALTYDYTSTTAVARGFPLITAINFKDGPKITEKSSGGLKLDYEPFRGLRFTLASSYTYFSDEIANRNLNFRVSAAQIDPSSSMTRIVANPVSGTGTRIEQTGSHGNKKTDTTNVALGFVYRKANWTVDAQTSYSRARQQNGSEHMGAFGTSDLQLTRISYIAERSSVESPSWTFTQTSGGDWYDFNNYGKNDTQTGNISSSRSRSKTQQWVNQVNARYVLPIRTLPTFIKGGLYSKLTVRDREQLSAYTASWVGPTGSNLTSRMPRSLADFRIAQPWGGNLYSLPVPDKSALYVLRATHPEYFTQTSAQLTTNLDDVLGSNQDVEEEIAAAYLLGNTRWKRLTLQAGLRYEKTETRNKVIETVPDNKNPYPSNTVERIYYRYSLGRTDRKGEYDLWLPSASATYNVTSNLVAKAGYHQAIQRPSLNRLAGQWDIDTTNLEITIPNPNLSPTKSDKYSLNLEYYFEPAGSLGVHFFQTDLDGATDETEPAPASEFGYGDDPVYGAYDFITFVNVPGKRTIRGMEFNYRQQLTFLPHKWLRGTRLFATYSQYTSSPKPNNFVPRNATAGLSWRYRRVNASIAGTWTDNIRTGSNTVSASSKYFAGDREFLKERYIFDVGFGLKLNRNLDLFVSGRNAFNSGKTWFYKDTDRRYRQMERYGGQWTIGVKGTY